MSAERSVILLDDADTLAEAVADRLRQRLSELQVGGAVAQLTLTGGRIATRAYQRLAEDVTEGTDTSGVDWSRVELWWGDERFVPHGDDDRNDGQALAAFGNALPLDQARIHPMPTSDAGDLDAAAAAYAAELGQTVFDICLLGMGPDGHVASLFPGHPDAQQPGSVIAVRNSPKPPPERISLTLDVINASREVWFCVSGEDKAEALAQALSDAPADDPLPAAKASGTEQTVWLIDRAAAAQLP